MPSLGKTPKYAFYIVSDVIYRLDNTEHTSQSFATSFFDVHLLKIDL